MLGTLLWYLLLAFLVWIALWVALWAIPAMTLCPACGGRLVRGFAFGRGEVARCSRCSYSRPV